ncbi:Uncharacterised protein [Mycobacteroides abscessus subsp. abscessus]|nr:Uncharacterised protein [Mycobacteroides abscessus subsp. abscessus]
MSWNNSRFNSFNAVHRGRRGWRARYTDPMPPRPSSRSMVYPAKTDPCSSIGQFSGADRHQRSTSSMVPTMPSVYIRNCARSGSPVKTVTIFGPLSSNL